MARRQPSSVLSICMSRILDTSSVSTLRGKQANADVQVRPCPSQGLPEKPKGLGKPGVGLEGS